MFLLQWSGEQAKTGLRHIKNLIMVITVIFFGILADVAQTGMKAYRDVSSFSDLMNRINDDFPSLRHYTFRVAVNNEIVNDDAMLNDRDEVAFLPPFAGG